MRPQLLTAVLLAAASLAACGGGSGGSVAALAPRTAHTSWIGALRAEPTSIQVSLSSARPAYMYVDSGATDGVYPSASAFAADVEAANPGLLDGPCSAVARMTSGTMQFTDAHGVQAPSYVVFFWPKAPGTCSQPIDLGADGVGSFSVTVTS